jgi:hypothetical protein
MANIKKYPFSHILGWSASRYDTFKICKRKYYYQYYAKFDTEFGREEIDFLKKLTSVALETGSVVHDVIEALFKRFQQSPSPINQEKFAEFTAKAVKRGTSRNFSEVYYKELDEVTPEFIEEKVNACLVNLMTSERFKWASELAIENCENWIIEPPGFGEVRLGGLKAYCKVDFLIPFDDEIVILDWKTGKKDEYKHSKQLLGYAAWAKEHFSDKYPDYMIKPVDVYLYPEYSEMSIEANEKDIQNLAEQIRDETQEMYKFCIDVENNVPKNKAEFPLCEKTFLCPYCNFRQLCER